MASGTGVVLMVKEAGGHCARLLPQAGSYTVEFQRAPFESYASDSLCGRKLCGSLFVAHAGAHMSCDALVLLRE